MQPKTHTITSSISAVLAFFIGLMPMTPVHADDLIPMNNDRSLSENQVNAVPGGSRVAPVSYGTNYDNQYPAYASFMQSPYGSQGNLQMQYGQSPYGGQSQGAPEQGGSKDPLNANEVSPYSRYSPYLEVVGEGSDYTLGIDDVVTIIVRNQPDFSGRFVIDPEGHIQYNFVGDIPAVGKTKEQLKADIIKSLEKFVRYPEVAVMISEYRSKAVYVFGFVNRPGKYAMKGDQISVREAMIAAGLPRMDAAQQRVYVIRPDNLTENGEPQKRKVKVKDILQKGLSADDFMLQPGDTLVVNQRYFDKFVNNFSRIVGPMFQAAAVYELGFGGDRRRGGYLN